MNGGKQHENAFMHGVSMDVRRQGIWVRFLPLLCGAIVLNSWHVIMFGNMCLYPLNPLTGYVWSFAGKRHLLTLPPLQIDRYSHSVSGGGACASKLRHNPFVLKSSSFKSQMLQTSEKEQEKHFPGTQLLFAVPVSFHVLKTYYGLGIFISIL